MKIWVLCVFRIYINLKGEIMRTLKITSPVLPFVRNNSQSTEWLLSLIGSLLNIQLFSKHSESNCWNRIKTVIFVSSILSSNLKNYPVIFLFSNNSSTLYQMVNFEISTQIYADMKNTFNASYLNLLSHINASWHNQIKAVKNLKLLFLCHPGYSIDFPFYICGAYLQGVPNSLPDQLK